MSTGQAIGGVVGAAAGFVLSGGTPMGAMYGAQVGMMAGGYLDPPKGPTMEGPRLSDLSVQTSTYGAAIPRTYGTVAVNGNVFWLENNKLKEVVKKEKAGGKGGGSSATTKTYTYFATLAIGLCEGPVGGIKRIWAGPNLIYDAGSDDLESIIASNQALSNFNIHLGGETQEPDSRMQADLGVANTSAYRGLCYIVIKDFALAKYGNAIPTFKVEVSSNIAESSPALFGVNNALPTPTQSWLSGSVKNAFKGAYFGTALFGSTLYVRMNKAGTIVNLPVPSYEFGSYFIYGNIGQLDEYDIMFTSSDGTESLVFAKGESGLEYMTVLSQYRFVNFTVYERGGEIWGTWTSDLNEINGDAPEGYKWGAKFYLENDLDTGGLSISYSDKFSIPPTATPVYLLSLDGGLWQFSASKTGGEAGNGYIIRYDENGSTSGYLEFSFPASPGHSISIYGAGYINDRNILHYLMQIYETPYDSAALYGKFQYIQIDLNAGQMVKTAVVTIPSLISASLGHINPKSLREEDGVIYFTAVEGDQIAIYGSFAHTVISESGVALSTVVSGEVLRTGLLSASDVVVTGLTDTVTGYRVGKIGSIRGSIEPLQGAFPFDVIQDGYKIKALPRGSGSVASIAIGDLGDDEQLKQSREMDSQMPKRIVARYLDRARDYDANEQTWERSGDDTVNTRTLDLPIVLSATKAAQTVERLGYMYWLERTDFGPFSLPPTFSNLQPADVVTLDAGYAIYEFRLTSVNYKSDGSIECMARLNNPSVYVSEAESDEVSSVAPVPLAGASIGVLVDCPIIDESIQNVAGYVAQMAGYTDGWPGGVMFRTDDNGQTWTDLQAFAGKGTFGTVSGALTVNSGTLIQGGGSITVTLVAGSLESITEAQMLNGKNYAAYGADGRWEVIRFQNATLNADGTYTLSKFIRGDRGTEWATGLHVSGDSFVLMDDPDGAWIGTNTGSIGVERSYRAITAGADIDSAASSAFAYQGVNLACYSPVHANGVRDGSGNLTIRWLRRTRIGGEWRSSVDASLGEASESYEVDILNGSTVVRTIASDVQSAIYSAANQTIDFGSQQSSITVKIYQQSATVGRGQPLGAIL